MMSGGPIEGFREGWAVKISFRSHPSVGHYYTRDELSLAEATCDSHVVRVAALRDLGTYRKCQRCETKLKKSAAP